MRYQSRKLAGLPANGLPQFTNHRPFRRGRPGSHLVDGHRLIGHGTDGVKQAGDRHRRGHLMPDVAGMVQVDPALEHHRHQIGKPLRQRLRRGVQTRGICQHLACVLDIIRRLVPGNDRPCAGLNRRQVLGQQFGQPASGVAQQFGIVGGVNPSAGVVKVEGG